MVEHTEETMEANLVATCLKVKRSSKSTESSPLMAFPEVRASQPGVALAGSTTRFCYYTNKRMVNNTNRRS